MFELAAAALEIAPDATKRAIADEVIGFEMPGATMAGFRRSSMIIAKAGIYHLRLHHDDVIMPILRHWDVFDRTGLGEVGEQARDEFATFLEGLDAQATNRRPSSSSVAPRTALGWLPSPTRTRLPTSPPDQPRESRAEQGGDHDTRALDPGQSRVYASMSSSNAVIVSPVKLGRVSAMASR